MSDTETRPTPPPSACPWTDATTGAGHPSIASSIRRSAVASATFASRSRSADERIHSTSAPAQKLVPVARQDDRAGGADVDERLRELGDQGCVERVP